MWLTSSKRARWFASSVHSRQRRLSSNCDNFRAPRIGITPRLARSQLSAACAGDLPACFAISATAPAMARLRSESFSNEGAFSKRFSPVEPFAYLPLNNPLASGDQAVTPRPSAWAIGRSSRSGVRSIRCIRFAVRRRATSRATRPACWREQFTRRARSRRRRGEFSPRARGRPSRA